MNEPIRIPSGTDANASIPANERTCKAPEQDNLNFRTFACVARMIGP